ncbi:MAG: hypothetical protein AB7P03_30415 [Kofleriaceae bacterium]
MFPVPYTDRTAIEMGLGFESWDVLTRQNVLTLRQRLVELHNLPIAATAWLACGGLVVWTIIGQSKPHRRWAQLVRGVIAVVALGVLAARDFELLGDPAKPLIGSYAVDAALITYAIAMLVGFFASFGDSRPDLPEARVRP